MAFADLTEPSAVLQAIAEADSLGREAFLNKYGFKPARQYFLHYNGVDYDSKAIVGAAHGFQHPELGPLDWDDFSGGEGTVQPKLEALGFHIVVRNPMDDYWWSDTASEKYWVEIRHVPGVGQELRCPLLDQKGHHNAWYDLVHHVHTGDIVFHWHARQSRFVGRSSVAAEAQSDGQEWHVPLARFVPLVGEVDLPALRSHEQQLTEERDHLTSKYPGQNLYLPFQFRLDGIRMMSNYFAKLPAAIADQLFGASGLADDEASDPEASDQPSDPAQGPSVGRYLEPFTPKADSEYVARIAGGPQRRGRYHETLVNAFHDWLVARGLNPGRNKAIDIGIETPALIVEAEYVTSWPHSVREAVGQLYEYRFFGVAAPESKLVFLASKAVPDRWRTYLEDDRGIAVAWRDDDQFVLTPMAKAALGIQHFKS